MEREQLAALIDLRQTLHMYPDLSGSEQGTARRLMDFIGKHTRRLEMDDFGHWFAVRYRTEPARAHILLRADIDALPIEETVDLPYRSRHEGISHKCGHDGHAAVMAGVALEIDRLRPDCNVTLLFQPAEERGSGALECLDYVRGLGADEVYAFHNQPSQPLGTVTLFEDCYACASKGLNLRFTGTPAHAAYPESGRNPAQAMARTIAALPALSDPGRYTRMVLCTVICARLGEPYAFGTSASGGELMLTIRGEREAEMDRLEAEIRRTAAAAAGEAGLSLEVEVYDAFPETRCHPAQVRRVADACAALGIPTLRVETPIRASEDFGHFLKLIPGAMFGIGDGVDHPDLHTQGFDFPDDILERAVALFVRLVTDAPDIHQQSEEER